MHYYIASQQRFVAQSFTPGTPPSFGVPRVIFERPFARTWTISPDGSLMVFIDSVRLRRLLGIEDILNPDVGGS